MRGPTDFEKLDRDARLAVLREVQHHSGIESEEYCKLARADTAHSSASYICITQKVTAADIFRSTNKRARNLPQ